MKQTDKDWLSCEDSLFRVTIINWTSNFLTWKEIIEDGRDIFFIQGQ